MYSEKSSIMAYAKIRLSNPASGEDVVKPIGISWIFLLLAITLIMKSLADWLNSVTILEFVFVAVFVLIVAFNVNHFKIERLVAKGFEVAEILPTSLTKYSLLDNNPIHYNEYSKEYYVWISFFEVKYMKYFKTLEETISYVKTNPCRDINHGFIFRAVKELKFTNSSALSTEYELPIDAWMEQSK